VFAPVRTWLEALGGVRDVSLERLNALAAARGLRTASGHAVRFVRPCPRDQAYELRIFASGEVPTRADSLHDVFNALAWLAFPRTKARLNAMHAAEIPREAGRRGPLRDLLTIFDEGAVIAVCDDAELIGLVHAFQWKRLFWEERARVLASMRLLVFGHAIMEKALEPWPGVTCKALFVRADEDPDAQAARWLSALPRHASPRLLPVLPVFGYPGWLPGSEHAAFYDDTRYFRPKPERAATEMPGSAPPRPRQAPRDGAPGRGL
jgi:hypothetical protein